MKRDFFGAALVPGYNLDKVDVAAGKARGATLGYGDAKSQMVIEYALMRHARGEEDGAQKTALSGGINLTTWYVVLATAICDGQTAPTFETEFLT